MPPMTQESPTLPPTAGPDLLDPAPIFRLGGIDLVAHPVAEGSPGRRQPPVGKTGKVCRGVV